MAFYSGRLPLMCYRLKREERQTGEKGEVTGGMTGIEQGSHGKSTSPSKDRVCHEHMAASSFSITDTSQSTSYVDTSYGDLHLNQGRSLLCLYQRSTALLTPYIHTSWKTFEPLQPGVMNFT